MRRNFYVSDSGTEVVRYTQDEVTGGWDSEPIATFHGVDALARAEHYANWCEIWNGVVLQLPPRENETARTSSRRASHKPAAPTFLATWSEYMRSEPGHMQLQLGAGFQVYCSDCETGSGRYVDCNPAPAVVCCNCGQDPRFPDMHILWADTPVVLLNDDMCDVNPMGILPGAWSDSQVKGPEPTESAERKVFRLIADMVNGGRLTEADVPDDFRALTAALAGPTSEDIATPPVEDPAALMEDATPARERSMKQCDKHKGFTHGVGPNDLPCKGDSMNEAWTVDTFDPEAR